LRFLDEAEALIALNLPAAAILVAGVVLESIVAAGQEQGTRNAGRLAANRKMVGIA
jgi:hypothetical protein